MRALQKSLRAGQEKMSAAVSAAVSAASDNLNNSLPERYKLPGGSGVGTVGPAHASLGRVDGACRRSSSSSTALQPPGISRGDLNDAAERGAHLLIRVEVAEGLDHLAAAFVALRVAGPLGALKGARQHTLAAPVVARKPASWLEPATGPGPGGRSRNPKTEGGDGGGTRGGGGRAVWRATRDLRCRGEPGDLLLLEVYGGRDVGNTGWDRCVARACVPLASVPPGGEPVTLTLHRNLARAGSVTIRRVDARAGAESTAETGRSRTTGGEIQGGARGGCRGGDAEGDEGVKEGAAMTAALEAVVVPRRRKRIFFVRHGESAWNEAQRELQFAKMIRFDHPLNSRGVRQAKELAVRGLQTVEHIEQCGSTSHDTGKGGGVASTEGDARCGLGTQEKTASVSPREVESVLSSEMDDATVEWVRSYAAARKCFTSPLTRAVQTAAVLVSQHPAWLSRARSGAGGSRAQRLGTEIGARTGERLSPPRCQFQHLTVNDSLGGDGPCGPGDGSVVFLRSLREIKATVGGLDTVGIEQGGAILNRCAAKLGEVMPAASADQLIDEFAAQVDVNDAVGHWWTSQDDVDTQAELSERMVG